MTDLCPSCKEPVDHPSGDGCAAMTRHQPHQYPSPEAIVRAALERAAKKANDLGYYCTGCGHICGDPERDLRILQRAGARSCCPDRKMLPLSAPILALASDPAEVAAIIKNAAGEDRG